MLPSSQTQWLAFFLALAILGAPPSSIADVDLGPQTIAAFDKYAQLTEARTNKEVSQTDKFLYVDGLPQPRRSEVLIALQRGEIYMEQLHTVDASGQEIEAPQAMIHHWLAEVFVPRASLQQTITLMQDYNRHQEIYKPEVIRSRLLRRQGNDFKVYLRLRKKKIITVTLDTEHDARYFPVDATHWYSRSYSTRIAEVENPDTAREREKPIGHDGGFLWRINSYWKFEEKDGGVYIECESISLTRDIPAGLGWLIKPFVTSIPKESLEMTMGSTRAALTAGSRGD